MSTRLALEKRFIKCLESLLSKSVPFLLPIKEVLLPSNGNIYQSILGVWLGAGAAVAAWSDNTRVSLPAWP